MEEGHEAARADPHRGQAAGLLSLRQEVHHTPGPAAPRRGPHGGEALLLRRVWEQVRLHQGDNDDA